MSESVLVGSFTLGGAFLGAVIGFLGAYLLEAARRRRDGQAAVRLLRAELSANAVVAQALVQGTTFQPFEDSVWQAVRFQLAFYLDAELFGDTAKAYFMFPYYQKIMERANETRHVPVDDAKIIASWRAELDDISQRLLAIAQVPSRNTPGNRMSRSQPPPPAGGSRLRGSGNAQELRAPAHQQPPVLTPHPRRRPYEPALRHRAVVL